MEKKTKTEEKKVVEDKKVGAKMENKQTEKNVKTEDKEKKETKEAKVETKAETKVEKKEETKTEIKTETKEETKVEQKQEQKKEKQEKSKQIVKKEEAIAKGVSISISEKHARYICSFIKGKTVDQAILELEQVVKMKRAIPFKGEIPHRRNMQSGRYPINASKVFISLLKGLKGNIIVNGLDIEKTKIYLASTARAFRPAKGAGRYAKRCHVLLKAKEVKSGETQWR